MRARAAVWLMVVLLPSPALAEGKVKSGLETRFFHLRSSVEGAGTADLTGLEFRWALLDPRGSFRVAIPALGLTGPASMISLGPAFASFRGGAGSVAGDGAGAGPTGRDAGNGTMSGGAPALFPDRETAQYGLGDVRLLLRRQVGPDSGSGRIFLDGGAKLPTADEEQGLGSGEADFWAGVAWRYEGWVANLEATLEWIRLGDPPGLTLQDGPGAGFFVEFPGGRGGLGGGIDAARGPLPGDPARIQAVVEGHRRQTRFEWELAVLGGLTESAPDFGLSVSFRF